MSCDDGNACTTDASNPATGGTATPVSCEDGDLCTVDSCDAGTGCTTAAVSCDDGNECTTDGCDPATGCTVTNVASGTSCNGGGSTCQSGVCQAAPTTCSVYYSTQVDFWVFCPACGADGDLRQYDGRMLIEYTRDGSNNIISGPVRVLHYSVYQKYYLAGASSFSVEEDVHSFYPACNGETAPTWFRVTDAGFPTSCEYDGTDRGPVMTGTLSTATNTITWDSWTPNADYWSSTAATSDASKYTPGDLSTGAGCLNYITRGNILCSGGGYLTTCGAAELAVGDNLQSFTTRIPMYPGEPGTTAVNGTMNVTGASRDTITTPLGGFYDYSYMAPNNAPKLDYFNWVGTRVASAYTTCN